MFTEEVTQLIKETFEGNPSYASFQATKDGNCFADVQSAQSYANSLVDKTVIEVKREDFVTDILFQEVKLNLLVPATTKPKK
jgi:hypothetical protein